MNTSTQEMEEALQKARHKLWLVRKERNYWKNDCLEQARLNGMGSEREAALYDALRGLLFFCEEDQAFASPAYSKAYKRAKRLVQSKLGANPEPK
jgi:hypothetical protein